MKENKLQFPDITVTDRYIIAIGASAGGLEAIHEFFDNMPANSGFTFIVIQHLSPDYKSLLVELVSKHTHMKVFEAENDMTLQRDCVYIIPNKKLMTIRGHKLRLADKGTQKAPNTAIDTFLFTLAKDKKEKAIAIILSGTGTDGTKGIEMIKECGGMVIVQEPSTAKFDGMPNSAITSGNADFILPPAKMHTEIYNYVSQQHKPSLEDNQPDDALMNQVFKLVHTNSGQDFNLYKTPTILRRIDRRMNALNIKDFKRYVELLNEKPAEVKILAKDFLINVTKFFRDKPAFDILAKDIIPKIIERKSDGEMLKIWICACSTGEEAYSIAILIIEELQRTGKKLELKIFATDVDEASIDIASRNKYPLSIDKEVPANLLKKYFVKEGKNYSIIPSVRKQIVFAKHNVIKSPPFIKNDLVTCRNMLIYMNNLLQQKVLATLHYSLNRDGYLFLGSSENSSSLKDGLTEISGKWKIYQKTGTINYGLHHTYSAATTGLKYADRKLYVANTDSPRTLEDEFRDLILEEFGTVGIFIDKSYTIKETIGNFNQFLTLPDKKLDLNILNMLSKDISVVLNTAIRKAWKENKKTHLNRVRFKRGENDILLQITVKPPDSRSSNGYTLLMFTETKTESLPKDGIEIPPVGNEQQSEYLMEMEAELNETRTNLQMAIEEMETTNEELQSSNEELLSANEELQSGNEELQSLNEELHTLNTEHQLKIRELIELNDDLTNYFRSTDIGQIFIDANLRIRKFNPAAVKMINLIEADIGRPINHISSNIKYDNLINDIHTVLSRGQMMEKEIMLNNGKNNLMRIMPYIKKDRTADGVVISFVDISVITELNNIISGVFNASSAAIMAFREMRNANNTPHRLVGSIIDITRLVETEKRLYESESKFRKVFESNMIGMVFSNMDGRIIETNDAFLNMLGYTREDVQKNPLNWREITLPEYIAISEWAVNELKEKGVVPPFEKQYKKRNGDKLWVLMGSAVLTQDNTAINSVSYIIDITKQKQAESRRKELLQLVKKQQDEFYSIFTNAPALITIKRGPELIYEFVNKAFEKFDGQRSYLGRKSLEVHPDMKNSELFKVENQVLKTGKTIVKNAFHVYRYDHKTGEKKDCWFDFIYTPVYSEDGNVDGIAFFGFEVTDLIKGRKAAEELMQKKDEFMSIASHELKTPITSIKGSLQILKRMVDKTDGKDTTLASFIDKANKQTGKLTTLVDDLLDVTKIQEGKMVLNYSSFDAAAMVKECLEEVYAQNTTHKIEYLADCEMMVSADRPRLEQVVTNFLTNAIKYSPKANKVIVTCSLDKDNFKVSVKDFGIGIPDDKKDFLFDRFYRVQESSSHISGLGLGLYISAEIIKRHHGEIGVNSTADQGSTFWFTIPIKGKNQ